MSRGSGTKQRKLGQRLKRNIPEELRGRPQWVCWRKVEQPGKLKPQKKPIDSLTAREASVSKQATWSSFPDAIDMLSNPSANVHGIGFVLTAEDPYVCTDLDGCRNPQTGEIVPWAPEIIERLNSYTEVSPSGTGVHIWAKGRLPVGGRRKGDVEMYGAGRYMTVTGHHLKGTPWRIKSRGRTLRLLFAQLFATDDAVGKTRAAAMGEQSAPSTAITDGESAAAATTETVPVPIVVPEAAPDLITKIRAAEGEKLQRLWNGERRLWSGKDKLYVSQSEADIALCRILALHTGCDPIAVDNLFRQSSLYREKWDERRSSDGRTYGEMTVAKAVSRALSDKWGIDTAAGVAKRPAPAKDWLINELIPAQELGIIVGDSSIGKSPLLYQAGICIASGAPFLGRITRQGRVLYIDLENSAEQAKQLISSLTKFLGIPMVPENLWFWNYNQASPTGNIRDYVLKMIRDLKPDFVIIDSLTAFHPEIEDKNSIATAVFQQLRAVARDASSAIFGVHHLRKPASGMHDTRLPLETDNLAHWFLQARGASALINACDVRIGMEAPRARAAKTSDDGREEIALLMRGFARVTGEIPACYISRHFDGSGEPVGYSLLAGAKLLRNTDQQDAYRLLPRVFRFKDAQMAYAKGGQATSDFLRKCTSLNILRRANGRYEKVIQQESSAQ